ncbi:ATP-binding protein [Christensenellaceae bacterium OttesenSCG-928-K19]|nr:ATP-binding protein [Christensenellaceae bacterium OttesenSCG-928-K19]
MFGAVLVTGARQVGKTTLIKNEKKDIPYITLDDPIMLQSAVDEPGTFFQVSPPPVFVDEIQYAPNLFPYIKMMLDKDKQKGQFYLSGSQQFKMMKSVTESLAGRLGILNLLGLSLREINRDRFNKRFLPTDDYFAERRISTAPIAFKELWRIIQRGSMPELYTDESFDAQTFYGAYTRTYIERDVRDLTQVGDEGKFLTFMTVVASHTGQLLNLASISRDVGISQATADRWLSILIASNLVYLLQPYSNNVIKRAIKTPKLYFLDTGLAAYLTRWNTPEVLESGAMAGAFFETFVISEIIKSYYNEGILDLPLYFYRDKDGKEIDLLIVENGVIYPLEIKKTANPNKSMVKQFAVLDKVSGMERGAGGVICLYESQLSLSGDDRIIPVGYL